MRGKDPSNSSHQSKLVIDEPLFFAVGGQFDLTMKSNTEVHNMPVNVDWPCFDAELSPCADLIFQIWNSGWHWFFDGDDLL